MEKKKFILTDECKSLPFTAPDGYFDRLEDQVRERISNPKQSWFDVLRPQLGFAVGFVSLVLIGYGGLFLLDSLKPAAEVMAVDEYAYATGMLDINEDMVLQAVLDDEKEIGLQTGDIMNYLADSNISLYDIASLD